MVTHPEMLRGSGIGKKVLSDFLAKVREEKEIKKIIATQVQYSAE
jgi:predicted GNAT family acetyltransferase